MVSRKPDWLRVKVPGGSAFGKVRQVLSENSLHTVCDEALCPNKAECWGSGTATFLILGDVCTRNCGFCAVKSGKNGMPLDDEEPARLADAVRKLGLAYVVLTSVDRDDLPDSGSRHYAECVKAVKDVGARVEVLIPDYVGDELATVVGSGPEVVAHNIEVVKRLQDLRDVRASYERSLQTLREVKDINDGVKTKSSIMLGLGESEEDVLRTMDDLRGAGCDFLILGQYLQPGSKQAPVVEYVRPEVFTQYGEEAALRGFDNVISEPLARTSYHAASLF
ncbi:MAG: lipoyl synthase [Candidatus Altiarchaeota archaeon]